MAEKLQFTEIDSRFTIRLTCFLQMPDGPVTYEAHFQLRVIMRIVKIWYQTTGNRMAPQHKRSTKMKISPQVMCATWPASDSSVMIYATFANT